MVADTVEEFEEHLEAELVERGNFATALPANVLVNLIRRVRQLERGPAALAVDKLDLHAGDVLIVRSEHQLALEEQRAIHRHVREVLHSAGITLVGVFIATPGIEFSVARSDG